MKIYRLKIFYADELVHEFENDLNAVLDHVADWLSAAVTLENVVNSKAFTFSITEVL